MGAYLLRRVLRALRTLLGTTLILFVLVRVDSRGSRRVDRRPEGRPRDARSDPAGPRPRRPAPRAVRALSRAVLRGDLGRLVRDRPAGRRRDRAAPPGDGAAGAHQPRHRLRARAADRAAHRGAPGFGGGPGRAPRDPGRPLAPDVLGRQPADLPVQRTGGDCSRSAATAPSHHLVLPAATLAIVEFFFYARFVHANVGATLAADYVRTARAKGVASACASTSRHALRNALIPIVTLLGLDVAGLMSGVVLTETVFNWPGLGRLAVQAVFSLDIPLVAGTVLFSATLVLVMQPRRRPALRRRSTRGCSMAEPRSGDGATAERAARGRRACWSAA